MIGINDMEINKRLLDNHINDSRLYVIAGVKYSGKTTLAMNLAEEYCKLSQGKKVLFYYASKYGELGDSDSTQIVLKEMSELSIQSSNMFLDASWTKEDYGLAAVIVDDYRFLLRTEQIGGKELTKEEKLLVILTRLKSLADAYEVPVIITSNVDDDYIWGRQDKCPRICDILDYEHVEALADGIILLHREDVFEKESYKKGLAELKICDLRTEKNTDYRLAFDAESHKFLKLEE